MNTIRQSIYYLASGLVEAVNADVGNRAVSNHALSLHPSRLSEFGNSMRATIISIHKKILVREIRRRRVFSTRNLDTDSYYYYRSNKTVRTLYIATNRNTPFPHCPSCALTRTQTASMARTAAPMASVPQSVSWPAV